MKKILTYSATALLSVTTPSLAQEPRQFDRSTLRLSLLVRTLDQDRDGEISAAELEKAPTSLAKLDTDSDGKLESSEMIGTSRDARSSGQRSRKSGGPRPSDLGASPLNLGEPGIAWYGRLDTALSEARRSNRPILFVAAASQCSGVPGVF
ncbi:MAG: hypothetical protein L7V86_23110 [Verrucomicrobiales bacterium]|nr:hypothetical protein [Verrucomicrobiales bacterium]